MNNPDILPTPFGHVASTLPVKQGHSNTLRVEGDVNREGVTGGRVRIEAYRSVMSMLFGGRINRARITCTRSYSSAPADAAFEMQIESTLKSNVFGAVRITRTVASLKVGGEVAARADSRGNQFTVNEGPLRRLAGARGALFSGTSRIGRDVSDRAASKQFINDVRIAIGARAV